MGVVIRKDSRWLGTYADFRRFLCGKISDACKNYDRFIGYDYAQADLLQWESHILSVTVGEDSNLIDSAYNNASSWFGVKELKSPFDNETSCERQFIGDYYGGGSFTCANICLTDVEDDDIKNAVDKLLSTNGFKFTDTVIWEESNE